MPRHAHAPMKLRLVSLALATLMASPLAMAAPAKPAKVEPDAVRIKALEQKLEQSLGVIEQLQQRLSELEKRAASTAVAKAPAPAPTPAPAPVVTPAAVSAVETRVAQVEQNVQQLVNASAASQSVDTGVPFHGFLDVGYTHFNKQEDGQRSGSRLGTFDVYLSPNLGGKLRTLAELAFEYDDHGGLAIDAERLQIGYAFSDQWVLWGGRFHTPYGYWNTAFHHGAQLQTPITRPRFIDYEDKGGIMPAHSVGVWGTGKINTEGGKVDYNLFAGNGDRVIDGVLDYNASGDDNNSPIFGGSVGWSPKGVPGLTLGLHGFQFKTSGSFGPVMGTARSQVLGGYLYWESDSFELIGEYYNFRNTDLSLSTARSRRSQAAFLQGSYNLTDRWYGFLRYEKASLKQDDGYFSLLEHGNSYSTTSLGLRYDLDPRAALKFQYDATKDAVNPLGRINALRAQLAVRF